VWPWNDRAGKLNRLKLAVFLYTLVPLTWLAIQAPLGWLGSKPLTESIHQSGDWAVRFLLLSLAVTPLRFVAQWPQLILVRRMLGLASLGYVLLHLVLYVALEGFDLGKVASEIVLRFYLTIGFVALLGLVALGITSTDGMIRRLGSMRWNRLHAIVYGLAALALLHFTLQKKLDISEPALMTGLFAWLMAFRVIKRKTGSTGPVALALIAIGAALFTAIAEALWYGTMTGIPGWRVFQANLDFSYVIRPAWWVLAAGVSMCVIGLVRAGSTPRRPDRARGLAPAPAAPQ
jgi:methionine sulfoxide reductase heme-binding subunit